MNISVISEQGEPHGPQLPAPNPRLGAREAVQGIGE